MKKGNISKASVVIVALVALQISECGKCDGPPDKCEIRCPDDTAFKCFNGFDEVCIGWDQVCDNYCHCFFLVEQCRDESATQCKLKRLRTVRKVVFWLFSIILFFVLIAIARTAYVRRRRRMRRRDAVIETGGVECESAPATIALLTRSNSNRSTQRLSRSNSGHFSRSNSGNASRPRADSADVVCGSEVFRQGRHSQRGRTVCGRDIDHVYLLPQSSGIMLASREHILPVRRSRSARETTRSGRRRRHRGSGSCSRQNDTSHNFYDVSEPFTRALSDAPPSYSDTCLPGNDKDHLAIPGDLGRPRRNSDIVTSPDTALPSYSDVVSNNFPLFRSLQDLKDGQRTTCCQ